MSRHETNIDTVALQIDCNNAQEQRSKMWLIKEWIIGRRLGKIIQIDTTPRLCKMEVLSNRTKVFSIQTGFTRKNKLGFLNDLFYIRIKFAGLKRRNRQLDSISLNALISICALLNTTGFIYRVVELDVALDIVCSFNNILAFCKYKVNNVPYNEEGTIQYYNNVPTAYIENYSKLNKRKNATMRFYVYDKSKKENLYENITRVELKLQNRFFLYNGFNLENIRKALEKYRIIYFPNTRNRTEQILVLDDLSDCKHFRLNFDIKVIKKFIKMIQSSYVDFYGRVCNPLEKNI